MSEDPATGALRPIDFDRLQELMPEIRQIGIRIKSIPFLPLIDSSDVHPAVWERVALIIQENYDDFDGLRNPWGRKAVRFIICEAGKTGVTKRQRRTERNCEEAGIEAREA